VIAKQIDDLEKLNDDLGKQNDWTIASSPCRRFSFLLSFVERSLDT
jgi:hypothetical protein